MELKKKVYAWYAVYTKTNGEKNIAKTLEQSGIECYLPLRKTLKQWSDRKKWIHEPLFKGYVFVLVSNNEFFDVLNIPGVFYYVSFGGRAQQIPEYEIQNVRTFIDNQDMDIILTREMIEKGTKAEILAGPLKGVKGEIVKICGKSRIVIRVESMGYSLHTNILKDEIKLMPNDSGKPTKRNPRQTFAKPRKVVAQAQTADR